MPKRWKGILIVLSTILWLQVYQSAVWGQHFNIEFKSDALPSFDSFTDIGGILTINSQTRTGDEVGVFYQGICCGRTTVDRSDGVYVVHVFNFTVLKDNIGPREGDVLEVRIWDAQRKVEIRPGTPGYVVNILDSAVKNASGNLIYKPNQTGKWRVDISYTVQMDVTQVVPNQSYTNQTQEITITGKNFSQGARVTIGTVELSGVTFVNATTLKATVPASLPEGTYDLTVTVGGVSATLPGGFKVVAKPMPRISRIIPNKAPNDQVTSIVILGSNLMEGSIVKIGTVALGNLVYSGDYMSIDAEVPAGIPAGVYPVKVIGPGGETFELSAGFTVLQGHAETMNLVCGLNFIAYPVAAPKSYMSYDFITNYFSPQTLDSLWYYKNLDDQWVVTYWDSQGLPSGDNFAIENGKGYLLYSKTDGKISFPGLASPFETQLYRGVNLVSFNPPSSFPNYTSYDLIQYMLNRQFKVVAIQRYEKDSGRWQITFGVSGKPMGDNFIISKDESYLVYMREDKSIILQ
ncbi:MAG: IPT/TIG domain-containing protein [bacterium]|nr:IPT/TIG domain-containing protein [bacterium]